ncbi:MAG: ATPase [Candidatus Riflebacteria bacterium]|nr:ATPase [Candidatus Riflebacteria bacterium]
MSQSDRLTVLCLASVEKGHEFIQECSRQGCRVLLLTLERIKDRAWPRDSIDEMFLMPNFDDLQGLIHTVSYLARSHQIDRIVPMDDYDVDRAAALREHLRCPGMGDSTVRYFRDKLAMRVQARDEGLGVPEFVAVLNYDRIREFMARVPPPWMLKPRMEAAALGIKKIDDAQELWRVLDGLGDRQSYFLLEEYVPGGVYHVDAISFKKEVLFAEPHRYGAPPFDVVQKGGLFNSRTLRRDSEEARELFELHAGVMRALRFVHGVTHSEFIKSEKNGKFYFLETAARVAGAFLANLVEASTGVNLWREWAKVEIAGNSGEYSLPPRRHDFGALIISLARQEWPDTSAYADPEIVQRIRKEHHAGLVLASPSKERIDHLLGEYGRRFAEEFLMTLPPRQTRMT